MATTMQLLSLRTVTRQFLSRTKAQSLCRSNAQRIQWQSTETQKVNDSQPSEQMNGQAANEGKAADGVSASEKKLQEENKKLQTQIAEVTDKYKRALAETENVRTRYKRQLDDSKLYSIQGFCKDLLEVSDVLDTATKSVPDEELKRTEGNGHLKSLYQGLQMTGTQLQTVFKKHNLHRIDPPGEKFDPNFHEALFEVPAAEGKNPGEIAVVTKVGFRLHNRTLRPALVGVVKMS